MDEKMYEYEGVKFGSYEYWEQTREELLKL